MHPFDTYPADEEDLRRPPGPSGNCRHGYGLDLQRRTGQTRCAYCGVSLVDDYYHWLLMAVDHVVPVQEARRLGVPNNLVWGLVNTVLSCSGCNAFCCRYKVPDEQPRDKWSLQEFIALRGRVLRERSEAIAKRRTFEIAAFERREWEKPKRAVGQSRS